MDLAFSEFSGQRILFVGEAVSLAHVGRPAMLARWAHEAGYDVRFACGGAFSHLANEQGLAHRNLKTIAAKSFYSRVNEGKFFYTVDELEDYVRSELEVIAEFQPTLIVSDFRLTLAISSALTDVRWVSLINAHWSPSAQCRFSAPDGAFNFFPLARRNVPFSLIRPLAFRIFAQPMNTVRRRFGLAALNDFRKHYTAGDYCAYLDIPELYPHITDLPRGHFFLGPISWRPPQVEALDLNELGKARPLVYLSLGSTGDLRILPDTLGALLDVGCDIVLSGISPEQASSYYEVFPRLQSRCLAVKFLDPTEVLRRAKLTICHGGSGTAYQSLAAGVPLLCLPHNPDQHLVSTAVASRGAGVSIEAGRATPANLFAAIHRLLNTSSYRCASQSLSHAIAQYDTRQNWLQFLDRVVEQAAPPRNYAPFLKAHC